MDCSGSSFPHSGPGTRLPQPPTLPSPKGKAAGLLRELHGALGWIQAHLPPLSQPCGSPGVPTVPLGRGSARAAQCPTSTLWHPSTPEQPSPCQSHPPGQTTPGLWEPSLGTGWRPCRTLRLGTAIPPRDEPPLEHTEPGTAQGWHIIPPDPLPALGLATSPGSGQEMLCTGTEALEKP